MGVRARAHLCPQHEHQILVFLGFVIYWRNRKATNWLHYLSNVFLYSRIANVALFFFLDPLMCAVYTAVMLGACVRAHVTNAGL